MRARRSLLPTIAAVALCGCAGAGQRPSTAAPASTSTSLRDHAARHAAIVVTQHAVAPLEPAASVQLENPLDCLKGCVLDPFCAVFGVACAGIVAVADVVAVPVSAASRHRQSREVERIRAACPLEDPGARVAAELARAVIQEFGFSQADDVHRGALVLEVRTGAFRRGGGVEWRGSAALRDGERELWLQGCSVATADDDVACFETDCETARAGVAALADRCVEVFVKALREELNAAPSR